jgi:regulator of sigma E protease
MNGLVMAAQLITALAILVTLHELGHFLAARAFGIKVEKFYLFFDAWGFKFFKFKKGDTEYGIGWLPLGGYVKIAGMVDESMDKEAMKQPPQPWEFRSKPAWQRLIVMCSGVTMNVLLGMAIYTYILFHFDKNYLPNENVKDGIYAYELGRQQGFETGDKIIAINGKPFERFDDAISSRVMFGATVSVLRNGKQVDIKIPDDFYKTVMSKGRGHFIGPDNITTFSIDSIDKDHGAAKAGLKSKDKIVTVNGDTIVTEGQLKDDIRKNNGKEVELGIIRNNENMNLKVEVDTNGAIGVFLNPTYPVIGTNYPMKDYTLVSAFKYGISDAIEAMVSNIKGLGKIFSGKEKATDSMQGPIGIATIYGGVWEWRKFWSITGLLSMVLAFMNILPIPALDGGHVLFLLIEWVTGKKFSDKFMEKVQIVGMVILLSLMVFIFGNDIWKHFIK